jgi:class 3 adenylate cyclase
VPRSARPAASGWPTSAPRAYTPEHLVDKIRAGQRRLAGKRKHVTVLFADVTGSMALAETVDTESWQQMTDRFYALLCEGVAPVRGHRHHVHRRRDHGAVRRPDRARGPAALCARCA